MAVVRNVCAGLNLINLKYLNGLFFKNVLNQKWYSSIFRSDRFNMTNVKNVSSMYKSYKSFELFAYSKLFVNLQICKKILHNQYIMCNYDHAPSKNLVYDPLLLKSDENEERKKREQQWKAMKYSFIFFGVTFTGVSVFLIIDWGAPKCDDEGKILEDEYTYFWLPLQYLLRSWNEVKSYNKMIKEPSREKLLPDPLTEPYYQPPYTLVIEMTGILVHPEWTYHTGWRFKKRPGVDHFLQQVGPPAFELVIYTSEQGFTAFPILEKLDPQGFVMYRLFRDSTRYENGVHIKDLNCLNRDLSRVIFVDWDKRTMVSSPRNGLSLPRWNGCDEDRTLFDLAAMLRTSGICDVRDVLDFYQQFEDPIKAFKENQLRLEQEQTELQQKQKSTTLVSSWTPYFLGKKRL